MRSRISSSLTDALLAAETLQGLVDQFLDFGIGHRCARTRFVFVIALAGLLAEAAGFAQGVGDFRLDAAVFARAPADIETGEIAHRERPHRHAELGHDGVDLLRQRALKQQLFSLLAALRQHAVADKAVAYPDHRRHLGDLARHRHSGGQRIRRGLVRAHDLAQLHDIGRREEVHAEHVLRTFRHRGDLIDVEIGGVGGEHRARLGELVERFEHFLLDRHGLRTRLR